MPDYKNFRRAFNSGSSDPATQRMDRAAKDALGLSSPDDDEEEKKRRMRDAIAKRAKFFSDTSDGGGE